MWWIIGISIWLIWGALVARIMFLDWKACWPNSYKDHWDYLSFFYVISFIIPPIMNVAIIVTGDILKAWPLFKEDVKRVFEYMGEWFKDNVDWKW